MLPRKVPTPTRQRRILNDPHLRPLAHGLTQVTNTQMVTVQQKTEFLWTQPGLQWKRELSVRQERCGPNWQRNTQAVGRSHIRCTYTTFTSITELSLFWENTSPRQYILNKIIFSVKNTAMVKNQVHTNVGILSNIASCLNIDYFDFFYLGYEEIL